VSAPPSAASLGLNGAPLLPLLPKQCILVADTDLGWLYSPTARLWLDGLYFRYRRTRYSRFYEFFRTGGKLWMTAITMQGDGNTVNACETCGLWADGHAYAEGALHVTTHVYHIKLCMYITSGYVACNKANAIAHAHVWCSS
jgi:hypothetical protein